MTIVEALEQVVRESCREPTPSEFFAQRFRQPSAGMGHITEPGAAPGLTGLLAGFLQLSQLIIAFVTHVYELPPSPAYEPLFLSLGPSAFEARLWAYAVRHCGKQLADEENLESPAVVSKIREIAEGGGVLAISRRASALRAEPDCLVREICRGAGHGDPASELWDLLEQASDGDREACRRLIASAKIIARNLPARRGRKFSEATAAHEFVLRYLALHGGPGAYTWRDVDRVFSDAATRATRIEFEAPDFDPRPARRRQLRRDDGEAA